MMDVLQHMRSATITLAPVRCGFGEPDELGDTAPLHTIPGWLGREFTPPERESAPLPGRQERKRR